MGVLGDLGQHVRLAQHEEVLAVHADLGTAVLGVEDLVALGYVQRDPLVAVVVIASFAYGEDLAALGLLLRGLGEDDAAGGRLLLLDCLDDHAIAKRLQLHCNLRLILTFSEFVWHSSTGSAKTAEKS